MGSANKRCFIAGGISYIAQNIPGNMMQKTIIIVQGPTGGGPLTLTVCTSQIYNNYELFCNSKLTAKVVEDS